MPSIIETIADAISPTPSPMKMSLRGRQRLTDREGKRLQWYRDSEGNWTCCVGHLADKLIPYKKGQTFTNEECDQILQNDLAKFENALNKALTRRPEQNQFDALLSVMFNVGPGFAKSTAIKRFNAGDIKGTAAGILMWNKPKAIIGRRHTEYSQFITPYVLGA